MNKYKKQRVEYTINKRVLTAVPCAMCGSALEMGPSVFLPNISVMRCIAGCTIERVATVAAPPK